MPEFPGPELMVNTEFMEVYLKTLRLQQDKAASEARIAANMAVGSDIAAQRELAKQREELAGDGENRVLNYTGEVTTKMLLIVRATMNEWKRVDAMNNDFGRPYEFQFTSPGGDILAGLAIFDYIRAMNAEHPVTTTAIGMCASMATVIVQAGAVRRSYPSTSWLIHEASWGAVGRQGEIEDAQAHVKLVQDRIWAILAERSHRTDKQLKSKAARKDWWFLGKEALEMGLIDELI